MRVALAILLALPLGLAKPVQASKPQHEGRGPHERGAQLRRAVSSTTGAPARTARVAATTTPSSSSSRASSTTSTILSKTVSKTAAVTTSSTTRAVSNTASATSGLVSKTAASSSTPISKTASSTSSSFVKSTTIPAQAAAATTVATSTTQCAPKYTGGAFSITGTGTLPKPTSFVTMSGKQPMLNGQAFRIVGPILPVGNFTDKGRVREALAQAVAMGANTIRLHTCGISLGESYSVEASLGAYGNWDIHDYVIYAAGQYGLRVILPLTDNWDYYHGGKFTNVRWRGLSVDSHAALFYTNSQTVADYATYVSNFMSRVNTYNGLKYANDPTILAWETGNELGGYIGAEGYPPLAWTNAAAAQIRAIDTNHLIIDGTNGIYNYSSKATAPGLNAGSVNLMSDHGYPRNIALLKAEVPLLGTKGFLIGEYDWTNSFGGDTLANYLSYLESTGTYIGDMIWGVMGHDAQCCNWVTHSDGYSMYYPNGNSADLQANALLVVQHWYRVTGRTIPSSLPGVACPQPVF